MSVVDEIVTHNRLHWSDYVVLVLYFLAVIGVGFWSSCLNRGSVGGYFLAGRNMNWILVGASLFASNIGSGHFIGLAGSGAASGIAISIFELSALFILLLLGWIFVPVYITSGVFTMPEYLKKRFGGQRIQIYLAALAIILYVFTKVSADLFAGAVFIKQSIGWDIWGSIIALLVLAMMFTIGGGLSAVIWTDFVQVFIMIIGAFVLMTISFVKIGGYSNLEKEFLSSAAWPALTKEYVNLTDLGANVTDKMRQFAECGKTESSAFHLMRPASDASLPWTGVLFGLTISSVWYWCSDQVIVQRALAAKNLTHAKAGTVLAAVLKLLPLFLMVFPGMISRILFADLVACSDPETCIKVCGNKAGCTNIAYPLLVVKLMPHGARGLMLAVMMSALMSSLTSIFNSSSTIFTMDIWRYIRKNASDVELMIVGRVFVLVIVTISIAWIPIIQNISELFHYIQGVTSFLSPPVCAVYVLAILWKRINEQGSFWGLMVGLVIGMIRFLWEYSYGPPPACGEPDTRHFLISKIHYLHFGVILFVIVLIVTIVVSLLTKPIDDCHLRRMTYSSRFEKGVRIDMEDREVKVIKDETDIDPEGVPLREKTIDSNSQNRDDSADDDGDDEIHAQRKANLPWYKNMVFWICGIENMDTKKPQAPITPSEEDMSIEEDPSLAQITNTAAIMLMIGAAFMIGYYA